MVLRPPDHMVVGADAESQLHMTRPNFHRAAIRRFRHTTILADGRVNAGDDLHHNGRWPRYPTAAPSEHETARQEQAFVGGLRSRWSCDYCRGGAVALSHDPGRLRATTRQRRAEARYALEWITRYCAAAGTNRCCPRPLHGTPRFYGVTLIER